MVLQENKSFIPIRLKIVQEAFTPPDEEITKAIQLMDAFKKHEQVGIGAFAIDGKLVDAPVIKAAENIITKARVLLEKLSNAGGNMKQEVAIVGVGWLGFQPQSSHLSYKEMVYEAAKKAYHDAGVDPRQDIQSFVTVAEDFDEGTSIFDEYTPDQIGAALRPVQTIPGDGLHGLITAYPLIKTKQFDVVAVEAHSKASNVSSTTEISRDALDPILNRPLGFHPDAIAGMEMNFHLNQGHYKIEDCARVVIKNRSNALINPSAAYPADLRLEEVLSSPPTSWPLTSSQTSAHADGAIVMVLASKKASKRLCGKPIWITGVGWCNDLASLEYRQWGKLAYVNLASRMAYKQAGLKKPCKDIGLAEIDDIYAYREILTMDALNICPTGEASSYVRKGLTMPNGDNPYQCLGRQFRKRLSPRCHRIVQGSRGHAPAQR